VATREAIMEALLKQLAASGEFATVGRRNPGVETIPADNTPALLLLEAKETFDRPSPMLPPKRTLHALAAIYYDVGNSQTAIPASIINGLLDGFETALAPDASGRCTLGDLVFSAMIDGEIEKAPGDRTGKGLAIVPIAILIP